MELKTRETGSITCRQDDEVESSDEMEISSLRNTSQCRRLDRTKQQESDEDLDFDEDLYDEFDEDELLFVKREKRPTVGGIGSSRSLTLNHIMARHNINHVTKNTKQMVFEKNNNISHSVLNSIKKCQLKAEAPRNRGLTRDTRATVDLVLDQRTIQILEKLMKWNVFTELFGCISTGKESNVYLGIAKSNDGSNSKVQQRAIKVFKTSILVFKDRARYIEGEFRFRRGYAGSSNPRKMVRQWAEKEYRNLKRLAVNGIRSPIPIELRGHVIAMTFLGSDEGLRAPKLKELLKLKPSPPSTFWRRIYIESIATLRLMFQDCKLVHGDFSEYNLLFHHGHPYVIDVSQAVEQDHPHALDFLKRDCVNVNRFFSSVVCNVRRNKSIDLHSSSSLSSSSNEEEENNEEIELISKKIEFDKMMFSFVEESEKICGDRLNSDWDLYSVQILFDYITKPDFINIAEEQEENWIEFDSEERSTLQYSIREEGSIRNIHSGLMSCVEEVKLNQRRKYFRCLCVATLDDLYNRLINHQCNKADNKIKLEIEEQVFLNTWTPSNLQELTNLITVEKELEKQKEGLGSQYLNFLAPYVPKKKHVEIYIEDEENDSNETDSYSDSDEGIVKQDQGMEVQLVKGCIPEGMDPKEWKKHVKEQNREKRKHKVPKHMKKKRRKTASKRKKAIS